MNKFRNVKHGAYDSRKEAKRGSELELMEKAGEISDLRTQSVFTLIPRQMDGKKVAERAITYKADFTYLDEEGTTIVEDVKSEFTRKMPVYRLKKKLMRYMLGIEVKEV